MDFYKVQGVFAIEPETCADVGPFYARMAPFTPENSDLVGRVVLACITLFLHVRVITFHMLYSPHPKYHLLWFRRLTIKVHVASGILEVIASTIVWFVVDCATWSRATAALAFVHTVTAIMQTPIVFGVQLVAIPAYLVLACLKFWYASVLFTYPCCYMTALKLYLCTSIYAWVRFWYSALSFLNVFPTSKYTASVLLSGLLNLPAINAAYGSVFVLLAIVYILLSRALFPADVVAYQTMENTRDARLTLPSCVLRSRSAPLRRSETRAILRARCSICR
jgi:hypothetical protein